MNISFDGNEATLTADNSLFPITDRETSNLSGAVIASPTADELRRRCMFGRSLDDDPNLQGWYEDSSGNTGIVCHDESDVRSSYRHVYLEDQPLVGAAVSHAACVFCVTHQSVLMWFPQIADGRCRKRTFKRSSASDSCG